MFSKTSGADARQRGARVQIRDEPAPAAYTMASVSCGVQALIRDEQALKAYTMASVSCGVQALTAYTMAMESCDEQALARLKVCNRESAGRLDDDRLQPQNLEYR